MLKFCSSHQLGEWHSNCTRLDTFSLVQRHKLIICWVESGKIIALLVRIAFYGNFLDVVYQTTTWNFYFEVLTTTRAPGRKSFFRSLYTCKPLPSKRKYTSPILHNVTNFTSNGKKLNLTQTYILRWNFRCKSCRGYFNSLIIACNPTYANSKLDINCDTRFIVLLSLSFHKLRVHEFLWLIFI